jgi:hypothetical protein
MDAPFPEQMMPDIERFFRDVHPKLKPGQLLYPEVFETGYFFPLQRQRELRAMMLLASDVRPRTVMEIGADKGGGLYHWCMLPTVENVIACEVRGTPYYRLFIDQFPKIKFHWMPCSSYGGPGRRSVEYFLQTKASGPTIPIDCLFIDGDKLAFEKDFDLYWPLVRDGGLVFLHDIRDHGPREAWSNILAKLPGGTWWHEVIDIEDANEAIKRENAGIPPANAHESWLRHWKGKSAGFGVLPK